ncbi:MAG TPA: DUF4091 domain-containing protein, partial [Bacillota bacterium]|nr:DUF4091 domain-containing protein [Bacillota bacterium]
PWMCNTFGRYNGDGHLIYPGANLKPYSSIRIETLRDGLEDYEYLWTLRDLLKRAEQAKCEGAALDQSRKLLSLDGVVKENGSYAPQGESYLVFRREIASAILKLQAMLGMK